MLLNSQNFHFYEYCLSPFNWKRFDKRTNQVFQSEYIYQKTTICMKKLIKLPAAILTSLILLSSCGPSLTVTNDYDRTANFSQFHTFKIIKLEQQYQALSQFNQTRVINAVQAQMIAKGFTPSETPDLLVNITSVLKNEKELVSNSYGYGGGYRPYAWGGGNMQTTTSVQNYVAGSLIIEVVNASTQKLLWEGIGNQNIDSQPSSADLDKTVPAAVQKIMASFPPGAATK
jgi:hypothetical protein